MAVTGPDYDEKLDHFVIDARHRWLVIKGRLGPLPRHEQGELAIYEKEIAAHVK